MDNDALKLLFAAEWLKCPVKNAEVAFAITRVLLSPDDNAAVTASIYWPKDPVVLNEIARLTAELGDDALLPGRTEFAQRLLREAEQAREAKDRLGFLKLYGELRGFIAATAATPAGKTVVANPDEVRAIIRELDNEF